MSHGVILFCIRKDPLYGFFELCITLFAQLCFFVFPSQCAFCGAQLPLAPQNTHCPDIPARDGWIAFSAPFCWLRTAKWLGVLRSIRLPSLQGVYGAIPLHEGRFFGVLIIPRVVSILALMRLGIRHNRHLSCVQVFCNPRRLVSGIHHNMRNIC